MEGVASCTVRDLPMGAMQERAFPFAGRIVLLGFGSIGQAVLPLLLRHLEIEPRQILIAKPSDSATASARAKGVGYQSVRLTPENHERQLEALLSPGDFLINLSVDVSSAAVLKWCQDHDVFYIDASSEPWPGADDRSRPAADRTNYAQRELVLGLRRGAEQCATALITLGANPGLVSFFVKQALLDLAGHSVAVPQSRRDWALLAQRLGVRVIHIAERDTQVDPSRRGTDEFVNTWSTEAFVGESLQPAELGWGSHERHFPADGHRQKAGCRAAIYLDRPGADTCVRSWTPLGGPYVGFLVTHAESISIADYLTVSGEAEDAPVYRPTVHYAYRPCDDALLSLHEMAGNGWRKLARRRIVRDTIAGGRDELGVLLMGHARGAYWYGSLLSIDQARELCPDNSATSLQVAAPIVAGVIWALRNPRRGILEPDDLPHAEMLAMIRPYLGTVTGASTDWTPLDGRERLFDEPLDRDDPWQFLNFRVM
jgi:homospermidine synthase